jgi:hypothetical protein
MARRSKRFLLKESGKQQLIRALDALLFGETFWAVRSPEEIDLVVYA